MKLFRLFFEGREDFLALIEEFEKRRSVQFISKLKKEKNRANFLSTIAELRFGLFFDEISERVQYDTEIHGKKPDYLVQISSQNILVEVARLNAKENDQKQLDFESAFMSSLEEIEIGCLLDFDYDEHQVDYTLLDFLETKNTCYEWLKNPKKKGDQINLANKITLTFEHYSDKYEHVCLISRGSSVDYDYRRLDGQNSALLRKCIKYNDIIQDYQLPYIVCLYLDFHTWFSTRDLYPRIYGMRVTDYGYDDDPIQFTALDEALYYSSIQEIKNVTGILVLQGGVFSYFHNYNSTIKLNNDNFDLLRKWQYIKE